MNLLANKLEKVLENSHKSPASGNLLLVIQGSINSDWQCIYMRPQTVVSTGDGGLPIYFRVCILPVRDASTQEFLFLRDQNCICDLWPECRKDTLLGTLRNLSLQKSCINSMLPFYF
jgi:hypothetical protein